MADASLWITIVTLLAVFDFTKAQDDSGEDITQTRDQPAYEETSCRQADWQFWLWRQYALRYETSRAQITICRTWQPFQGNQENLEKPSLILVLFPHASGNPGQK